MVECWGMGVCCGFIATRFAKGLGNEWVADLRFCYRVVGGSRRYMPSRVSGWLGLGRGVRVGVVGKGPAADSGVAAGMGAALGNGSPPPLDPRRVSDGALGHWRAAGGLKREALPRSKQRL